MLNNIVKSIRIANDMSTKEASQLMGVRPSFLSELESGVRNITIGSLNRIALAYNIPVSKIMFFEEQQKEKNMNYRQTLIMILEYCEYENNDNLGEKPKQFVK